MTNATELETRNSEPKTLRGFWALIVTQFQGAFSDNVVKNLAIFVALFGATMTAAEKNSYGEAMTELFSLPFILFSMAGGFLADRFSKRSVMLGVKIFELFIMSLVFAGLLNWNKNLLLAGVFLMGTHSAIFGPSKYGSLPELLPEKKLSWGNGILELGTNAAIILGIAAAALMSKEFHGRQWLSGMVLIALAVFGFFWCLAITKVPAADPLKKFQPNFPAEIWRQVRAMRGDRPLWLALCGNTYFNFLGMLLLLNLFFYGSDTLHVAELEIGFLSIALALGIGAGSVLAGYLSGGKIEYGLVPLGAVGLSIFSVWLSRPSVTLNQSYALLALLGLAGGFFIVPVAALLQHRPNREKKGQIQALANWWSFVGVFLAAWAHWLLVQKLQFSPCGIFLVGGIATFVSAIYVLFLLPDALLRFILWAVTKTIYRTRVIGRDNIPTKGGALFVCNHVSFVDALLLLASTDRQVRFMMFKGQYELPWIKPFAKILGVIPISSDQRPREMLKSLQTASDAIRAGDVVCIFAEGQITRIGHLLPFRRGFQRIMKNVEAPIIPVALDGVWGSIFSFERGRFLWKLPHRRGRPITINYGKPMPHDATPFEVRQVVQELLAEAWTHRKSGMKTLHRAFIRTARRHPFRFAMADGRNKKVSFISALARTIFLSRRLEKIWGNQKMVGLLLPPSVGGALVNFAAMLCGKIPVNLNYTVAEETLSSCVRQCEIKTVVTSRAFLDKLKIKLPGEVVFLEDVAASPSVGEKIFAALAAWLLPAGLLERALRQANKTKLDDLATVIFSSGSTGDPKGVMLSHYNIGANIEQLEQVFGLGAHDCFLGILPFFHSFGFTGTLCLPAMLGVGVVYHPNPLDAKTIGPLVREYEITFLLSTPTFLQFYLRACSPEDFGSLRVVVTAAEKLSERLATAFEEQFGIRPLEGYGCTECAPCVAVNTHDFRSAGFRQIGAKRGKIGHPVPGVSVKIVDPETRAPLGIGQAGLMLVRGPNVMQGYLGKPEKTAEVLIDNSVTTNIQQPTSNVQISSNRSALYVGSSMLNVGCSANVAEGKWYVTGDIAALDEDGFLQITDRLSRFSKIGGEMVPHIKVEEKLHELAGVTEQTFVVASVPDEKKGERLVVLHKLTDGNLPACVEKLAQSDLPNLWKPRADQFFRVENFPLLGTGKLDLRKVKEMAANFSTSDTHG